MLWPNLLKGQPESSLWQHEWDKHGTCSTKNRFIRGEFNYFNHTLSLFDSVTVAEWLESGKISPGSQAVRKDTLKALLKSKVGKEVTIHCVSAGLKPKEPAPTTTQPPQPVAAAAAKLKNLESIHICYDKTDISLIDCQDHDSCPNEFLLPSKT